MRFMVKLYETAINWAQHKHAPRYLALLSFIEASVFPIPPYVMLAPMSITKPSKAINYAAIATIASVIGGVVGYILGYLIFKPVIYPMLEMFGYLTAYEKVVTMFDQYGIYALLILGVTPIPYKVVAIGSGFLAVPIPIFILTSILSRGIKFMLLASCIKLLGNNTEELLRRAIQKFGVVIMGLIGVLFFVSLKVI